MPSTNGIRWTKARRKAHGELIRKRLEWRRKNDKDPMSLKNLAAVTMKNQAENMASTIYPGAWVPVNAMAEPIKIEYRSTTDNDIIDLRGRVSALESRTLLARIKRIGKWMGII